MNQSINRLIAVGIHGRFDIDLEFSAGVNIVHGSNGTGKTTLLHILTNAANLDVERFANLSYRTIRLEIANGRVIEFTGVPSERDEHLSDVTLFIDDQEVATWPPDSHDRDPAIQRSLFSETLHPDRDLDIRFQRRRDLHHQRKALLQGSGIAVEATYFPAFRTMIEAWSSLDLSGLAQQGVMERAAPRLRSRRVFARPYGGGSPERTPTRLAREVFGQFVPSINYLSPRDIEHQLDQAIQRAVNRLANEDRSLFSNAFTRVFDAISKARESDLPDGRTADAIRASISDQLDELQSTERAYGLPDSNSAFLELKSQLRTSGLQDRDRDELTTIRILKVYEEALKQRASILTEAFHTVHEYIDAVNDFLEGKQLVTATPDVESTPRLQIRHEDDGKLSPLDTLSSGERQIAGLIYSASHVAKGNVILVDEPELSLHIDWQQKIIQAMVRQLPSKQLIVCTHSPVIASDYLGHMIELVPKPTEQPLAEVVEDEGEIELWEEAEEFEEI